MSNAETRKPKTLCVFCGLSDCMCLQAKDILSGLKDWPPKSDAQRIREIRMVSAKLERLVGRKQ